MIQKIHHSQHLTKTGLSELFKKRQQDITLPFI